MAEILNSSIVLRLSKIYTRLGWSTVAEAFTAMNGGATNGDHPAKALDIEYELNPDGTPNYEKDPVYFRECDWDEWIKLPIRPWDMSIRTSKLVIRVPTVIIAPNFSKVITKRPRATPKSIRERDGNKCQYTGRLLNKSEGSLDHVIPKSRGGKDDWENLVYCDKNLNSKKGNRLNQEIGLKLLRTPFAPKAMPLSSFVVGEKHPDHQFF